MKKQKQSLWHFRVGKDLHILKWPPETPDGDVPQREQNIYIKHKVHLLKTKPNLLPPSTQTSLHSTYLPPREKYHIYMCAALTVGNTFKRKASFSECGNSPPAWHNLRVQPDNKLAQISAFSTQAERIWFPFSFQPHVLPPLSLQVSPEAGSTWHIGVKQGWKKETFCQAGRWIRSSKDQTCTRTRARERRQKERREEQDCTFQWQWLVWLPQLCSLSCRVHRVGCKNKQALPSREQGDPFRKLTNHKRGRGITLSLAAFTYIRLIMPFKPHFNSELKQPRAGKVWGHMGWQLQLATYPGV